MGHGQHGQARLTVVLHPVQGQRPKMRRCPQENDEEQDEGLRAHTARHGGPAQHGRHGPRGPADHDVLRRERLQNHGVDHGVAHKGGKGQPHGERVNKGVEQPGAQSTQHGSKQQGLCVAQVALGGGPPRRALHARVNALLHDAIKRSGCASHQPDAGAGQQAQLDLRPSGQARHGQHHANQGTKHNELNHARLGQSVELLKNIHGSGVGDAIKPTAANC